MDMLNTSEVLHKYKRFSAKTGLFCSLKFLSFQVGSTPRPLPSIAP